MVIKRNGNEIHLTGEELFQAYQEQLFLFDRQNVYNEILTNCFPKTDEENTIIMEILRDDEAISSIACEVRKRHENEHQSYWTALNEAINEEIKHRTDGQKEEM